MTNRMGSLLLLVAVGAAGCATGQNVAGPTATARTVDDHGAPSCNRASRARPLGAPRAGSTIALAKLGGKRIAFVADEDARSVTAIDVDASKELATTPLAGTPSQLMIASDGRVLVLLRDRDQVQVLAAASDSGALTPSCAVATPPEPVALAASPDDHTIVVTSGWGRKLRAFDAATFARRFDVALPREPRAVVVGDDGATAFVSHAVGSRISAVDLASSAHTVRAIGMRGGDTSTMAMLRAQRKALAAAPPEELEKAFARSLRSGCQGFALAKSVAPGGRVLAPQVLVDPGDPENRPEGYGDDHTPTEMPSIAVVDEGSATAFDASLATVRSEDMIGPREARDHRAECLLPRAAAVDPRSHTLFVSCFGIDTVIAYDAASARPATTERRRWTVGAGPSGIAVDPERPQAFVWSQFDRAMQVLALNAPELVENEKDDQPAPRPKRVALAGGNKLRTDVALGRMLFHAAGDGRISHDGRACASCHPDGRDDALTWATPEGPRRSILLAGRVASTAPYSWNGTNKTLHDHITRTFDRLNGTGLRSLELDALIEYVTSLRAPGTPEEDAAHDPKVARGAAIFASREAGCAGCHVQGMTFADGATHDIGSKAKADKSPRFDTPSLHLVGGTGPYFHDGRYADLKTLLRDTDGRMGSIHQLSEDDLDALVAYVRTL